jgi:tetratricopeptide (TPR) repeat protein
LPGYSFFDETTLNQLGYTLMDDDERINDAIALFEWNVESYPASFNVYDSLGEAYLRAGNKELAIRNYRKSFELNPDNTNAKKRTPESGRKIKSWVNFLNLNLYLFLNLNLDLDLFMKILAIEKPVTRVTDEQCEPFLLAEAHRAYELYQSGIIRELYFRADRTEAVLILECESIEKASEIIHTLPLVKNGLIDFELIPLAAYPGFSRLFTK